MFPCETFQTKTAKVANTHFYINPAFSGLPSLSSKTFDSAQVTRFLEGPTTTPHPPPVLRGVVKMGERVQFLPHIGRDW